MKKNVRYMIGVPGIIAALGISIYLFSMSEQIKWLVFVGMAIIFVFVLGFAYFIAGGMAPALIGAAIGFLGSLMMFLSFILPQPYHHLSLGVIPLVFFVIYIISDLKAKHRKNEDQDDEDEDDEDEDDEYNVYEDARFAEKYLILTTPSGSIFQMIKGENCYYLNKIGRMQRIDTSLVRADFTDESKFAGEGKHDRVIYRSNINSVAYKPGRTSDYEMANSGIITISSCGRKKSFAVNDEVGREKIRNFFSGVMDFNEKVRI